MKIFKIVMIAMGIVSVTAVSWAASDELARKASWQIPTDAEVQAKLTAWLEEQGAEQPEQRAAAELWEAAALADVRLDRLERIALAIAVKQRRAVKLLAACRAGATPETMLGNKWLDDNERSPLVRNNLRLLLGRSLAQGNYFDEALQLLESLQPTDVQDPASLLFYQGVVYHRLVQKDKGLAAIDRLLENKQQIPRRFSVLARLMRADLTQLKDGSLDDISRRMKDIERRLDLGRAGRRVRDIEDEVIEMLDKLIKEEEEKQKQAMQAAGGGGTQPTTPMQDSRPAELKAPGEVTKRNIGKTAGWGDLPPKEREEAMQEIGRDFPAHYREAVEEYFRELAKQEK